MNLFCLLRFCGSLGSNVITNIFICLKECYMTMSHYVHHFRTVLVAGRKLYIFPENKIDLRIGGRQLKIQCNINIAFLNNLQSSPTYIKNQIYPKFPCFIYLFCVFLGGFQPFSVQFIAEVCGKESIKSIDSL